MSGEAKPGNQVDLQHLSKIFIFHVSSHVVSAMILVILPYLKRGAELSGMWLDGEAQLAKDLSKDDVERVIIQLILDGILVIAFLLEFSSATTNIGLVCNGVLGKWHSTATFSWKYQLVGSMVSLIWGPLLQHYCQEYAQKNLHIFTSVCRSDLTLWNVYFSKTWYRKRSSHTQHMPPMLMWRWELAGEVFFKVLSWDECLCSIVLLEARAICSLGLRRYGTTKDSTNFT